MEQKATIHIFDISMLRQKRRPANAMCLCVCEKERKRESIDICSIGQTFLYICAAESVPYPPMNVIVRLL